MGILIQSSKSSHAWESRWFAGCCGSSRVLNLLQILSWDHRHPDQARGTAPKEQGRICTGSGGHNGAGMFVVFSSELHLAGENDTLGLAF